MKIRTRLLILLLVVALSPLVAVSLVAHMSTHRLGRYLAGQTRQVLIQNARLHLHEIVRGYGGVLDRDKRLLESALRTQAREIERRLREGPPPSPQIFFSRDYDSPTNSPPTTPSTKHFRQNSQGQLQPILATYEQQVYFVVASVDPQAVADDLACLSTMPRVYKDLYQSDPEMIYWQYTALESGFHSSYPGHGGYPDDYDPRVRTWYLAAKQADSLVWIPPMPDVSTRTVPLTLAMPVRRPDGSFAGVTAIDVPLNKIFKELQLPENLRAQAKTMVVRLSQMGLTAGRKLGVAVQKSYDKHVADWRAQIELEYLESSDQEQLAALMEEALSGISGVRQMPYKGRDSLWAYGAGDPNQPFPVVIVPYDLIIAQAEDAERKVLSKTIRGLKITGIILAGVVVIVVGIACYSSARLSEPLLRLTVAAKKLAKGDYSVRVNITCPDELRELGEVFNNTGPKLREREQMKQSLDLAMEIQQNLLPQESPQLDGFDIAGKSVYCDETGGDYYDFIDLFELGPAKLGIAVGDVTGHGIGAALLMVSARAALRSHANSHSHDLTKLFSILNTHLVRDTGDQRFMTLFYGILDSKAHSLQWTSGGHDPAMWLHRSTSQIEELPNTGIPLGVMENVSYKALGPVTLQSSDIVLIGTDGIWEASDPAGQMFGKERLRQIIIDQATQSAAKIRTAVVQSVNQFIASGSQKDDITLVVIKKL